MFRQVTVGVLLAWSGVGATGFWVDLSTFRAPGGGTEVELSVKLSTDSLGVLTTTEGERAAVSFSVTVQDSAGTPLLSDRWERLLAPPPDSAGHDVYFLDSSTLEMPPGKYTFDLAAVDRGRDRTFEVSRVVTIPAYAAPGLMLSDMLVSNSVPLADAEGQFVREGFRIIPSPDRAFGASGPMLYVYQEVYNLSPSSALADSFSLTYRIVDRSGHEARSFSTKGKSGGESRVIKISGLSLAGIPPGRYDLEARVEDPITGLRTSGRRDILIVASRRAGDASASELSDEQMLMSRDLLVYLASSREKALFESLDEAGKDNFIRRFWTQRDPERSAAGNPYLEEMTRRYEYVNDHYGGHNPGWRTDRGRVYITYGPPKELDRNISNPGTRDHEIWTYAIEGQGKFIFVDERGYGDYRLVHSTVRGEVDNPEWEGLLELIDDQR